MLIDARLPRSSALRLLEGLRGRGAFDGRSPASFSARVLAFQPREQAFGAAEVTFEPLLSGPLSARTAVWVLPAPAVETPRGQGFLAVQVALLALVVLWAVREMGGWLRGSLSAGGLAAGAALWWRSNWDVARTLAAGLALATQTFWCGERADSLLLQCNAVYQSAPGVRFCPKFVATSALLACFRPCSISLLLLRRLVPQVGVPGCQDGPIRPGCQLLRL